MNAAPALFVQSCPAGCDAPMAQTDISMPEGPLRRCTACGQLVSAVSSNAYDEALKKWDTESGTAPTTASQVRHDRAALRRLANLRRLISAPDAGPPRLLDVGCSNGSFMLVASSLGWSVEGVEPSPKAAAAARSAGLTVHAGFLEDVSLPAASFDAICLIEVMEHLRDAVAMLATCRKLLRPGGVILVTTPNASSWTAHALGGRWESFSMSAMGGHISFFSPDSVAVLAGRCALRVVHLETRRVRLAEKSDSAFRRALARAGESLLDTPSRWLSAGHQMDAYLGWQAESPQAPSSK